MASALRATAALLFWIKQAAFISYACLTSCRRRHAAARGAAGIRHATWRLLARGCSRAAPRCGAACRCRAAQTWRAAFQASIGHASTASASCLNDARMPLPRASRTGATAAATRYYYLSRERNAAGMPPYQALRQRRILVTCAGAFWLAAARHLLRAWPLNKAGVEWAPRALLRDTGSGLAPSLV